MFGDFSYGYPESPELISRRIDAGMEIILYLVNNGWEVDERRIENGQIVALSPVEPNVADARRFELNVTFVNYHVEMILYSVEYVTINPTTKLREGMTSTCVSISNIVAMSNNLFKRGKKCDIETFMDSTLRTMRMHFYTDAVRARLTASKTDDASSDKGIGFRQPPTRWVF